MAVTITPTPASGSITAKETVVRFDIAGADPNDESGYDADAYPTSPEFRYVLTMVVGGEEEGRSLPVRRDMDGAALRRDQSPDRNRG